MIGQAISIVTRQNYYVQQFLSGNWPLPVTRVCDSLNPFVADGVILYAVLGYHLPYDTMKFLTVLGLLEDAHERGMLRGVGTLVEATSGATGYVLTQLARSHPFNVRRVVLIMKEDVPLGKRYPPHLAGAEIRPPEEGLSPIGTARRLSGTSDDHGLCLNLDQYGNMAGANYYREWAAEKILATTGEISVIFPAIGTGGSVIGLRAALARQTANPAVVGVMCAPQEEIPGVRDLDGMKEITLPWRDGLTDTVEVHTRTAYLSALWFQWEMGLTPGASGGLSYAGALQYLYKLRAAGGLDRLRRKKDGKIVAVVVFHDNARPYVTDRFTVFLSADMQRPQTAPRPWTLLGQS